MPMGLIKEEEEPKKEKKKQKKRKNGYTHNRISQKLTITILFTSLNALRLHRMSAFALAFLACPDNIAYMQIAIAINNDNECTVYM